MLIFSTRKLIRVSAIVSVLIGSALSLQAGTITDMVTVNGTDVPWLWSGSLNTAYQFGLQNGTGPAIVNSTSGISFAAGSTLIITFLNGSTTADDNNSTPYVDANGYAPGAPIVFAANNSLAGSGTYFPSDYMSTYPIYLTELVGTFTDSLGNIVGTPFAVGDGPTDVVAPNGASQLQLGINDDNFSDNAGSLSVSVQGSDPPSNPTPEPASLLLIALPLGALTALEYRKRRRGSKYNGA